MVKHHRRRHAARSKRTRKHRGGGLGQSYTSPGAPLVPGVDTGVSFAPTSSCMAAAPPGQLSASTVSSLFANGGLPGMRGGKRRGRRSRRAHRRRRTLRGGAYTTLLGSPITPGGAALLGNGNYPEIARLGCEGGSINTAPPGAIPRTQTGGAATPLTPADLQGAGPDNVGYYAPTAGYAQAPSSWVSSVGAPVQIQVPYDVKSINPACNHTGGGKRRRMSHRRRRTVRKH